MIASVQYSTPVMVNGFSCRNCSEVDQAKKNIDPADPGAGPFGINAKKTDTAKTHKAALTDPAAIERTLSEAAKRQGSNVLRAYTAGPIAGQLLHLTV